MMKEINYGKLHFLFNRLWSHLGKGLALYTFLAAGYLASKQNPAFVWIGVVMVAVLLVIGVFDIRFVLPKEYSYAFSKNPKWVKVESQIDRIEAMLEEMKK